MFIRRTFIFCALASLLTLAACVEPSGQVSKTIKPHESGKIYNIVSTKTSISNSGVDINFANTLKPYIEREVNYVIAPSFKGRTPAKLDAEIIYAQFANKTSKVILGANSGYRVRLTLSDPKSGQVYKKVYSSGGEDAIFSALGGFSGRAIESMAKGKQTKDQRLNKMVEGFSYAAIYHFNKAPE